MSQNRVIGKDNDLPWRLSDDLKHFAKITKGHTVVMGRKTYESIIQRLGKPLPDRRNIVVTSQADYIAPEVEVVHSVDEISELFSSSDEEVFVIGGGEIYKQLLPLAKTLYITEVLTVCDGDTYFPEIDTSIWEVASRETHIVSDEKNSHPFTFLKLIKK